MQKPPPTIQKNVPCTALEHSVRLFQSHFFMSLSSQAKGDEAVGRTAWFCTLLEHVCSSCGSCFAKQEHN
jgi:hypothetical protein